MPKGVQRSRPQPTGGKGGGKRKLPQGGKPAKQAERPSKRRHRSAADVYEAEDSDPDEVKHAERYDRVENYEYELPSDFEDEEIDEELAFTEEDKKKFGEWFGGKDGSDGSDGEFGSEGEEDADGADMELLDSDQELPERDDEDDEGEDDEDEDEPSAGGFDDDEDEDAFLDQLGGSDDDGDEGDDDDDMDADEERHRDLLAAVTGKVQKAQKAKGGAASLNQGVISEAVPESEFNLDPTAASTGAPGELSVADLMRSLGGEAKKLGAARKVLDKMASSGKAVDAPLPRNIKERVERKAGYETTSKDVTKWQPLVKANREAPTLAFTSARHEVPRTTTTAAIVHKHMPDGNEMEEEVAALLAAAGAATMQAVQEAEEQLAIKALTLEEARARRERLAKMRSLLFYHELKAKRVKAIKSKEYHRKVAKAEKRKALKLGSDEAAAALAEAEAGDALKAAREELEAAEFDRAKERLTLKHRNTSKWARRALKRGVTVMDAGTKAALQEQLAMGEALRRRIEGRGEGGSDDEDDDSEGNITSDGSDGEGGGEGCARAERPSRAKVAALELLAEAGADGEAAPKKGLFALPFMRRALEKKRLEAQHEATQLLHELEQQGEGQQQEPGWGDAAAGEGDDDGAGPSTSGREAAGRMRFGMGSAGAAGGSAAAGSGRSRGADDEALGWSDGEGSQGDGGDSGDDEEGADQRRQRSAGAGTSGRTGAEAGKQQQQSRKASRPTAEDEADLDRALAANGRGTGGKVASQSGMQVDMLARPGKASQPGAGASHSGRQGAAAAAADGGVPFIAAPKFAGARGGYVFKSGPSGVGYYADATSGTQQQQQQQKQGRGRQQQQQKQAKAQQKQQQDQKQQAAVAAAAAAAARDDAVSSDDEGGAPRQPEGMAAAPGSGKSQKDLISMAFAGDDVEADFAAAKAEEVAGELPEVEAPSALPGWGAWTAQQRDPKWMRDARDKAAKLREAAAAGRRDAKMSHVVLSEKWDKKASKYATPEVPYPFTSKEAYERSLRQPLGRQYNPDTAFRDLTRPAVLKSTGVIIDPIRFSKPLAKAAHSGSVGGAGIITVAGGMVKQQPKKKNVAKKQ